MELARWSPDGAANVIVDVKRPLSESFLWKLQREYFRCAGIKAWSQGIVPHYITCNPVFADACADVVFGFLCDCRAAAGQERSEPVQILELGAGSGRFGYLFLKTLSTLCRQSAGRAAPFRYILSDLAEENVAGYRSHPALQPFIAEGTLDFAVFDLVHDAELRLELSGETLPLGPEGRPLAVIANYVFDSVPHDAFLVREGRLFEQLITLHAENQPCPGDSLETLQFDCMDSPVEAGHYKNASWEDVLRRHAGKLKDASFLFPCSAFRFLDRLCTPGDRRLLLLCTDKGEHHPECLGKAGDPVIEVHGSISVRVNFDAIREYFRAAGGFGLLTPHRHTSINTGAFVFSGGPEAYSQTQAAYRRAGELFGPDDFYTLKSGFRELFGHLDLEGMLAFLRLSHCDPHLLLQYLPSLRMHAETASGVRKKDLRRVLLSAWQNYFHIGEERDLASEMASLLYEMGFYAEALSLFHESRRYWGPDPATSWNIGLCEYSLGKSDAAMEWMREASRQDASFRPAATLQAKKTRRY